MSAVPTPILQRHAQHDEPRLPKRRFAPARSRNVRRNSPIVVDLALQRRTRGRPRTATAAITASQRCQIHDGTACGHVWHCSLGRQEGRGHIELHDPVEELFIHFIQLLTGNHTAGVVDENVDLVAKRFACSSHQSVHFGRLGDISFDLDGLAASSFDCGDGRVSLGFVAVVIDNNFGTFAAKLHAYGPANIAAAACNNCGFACKFHIHFPD